MTRKHFKLIADALKRERPLESWGANKHVQWDSCVRALADVCATQNANFKRDAFLKACGGLFNA